MTMAPFSFPWNFAKSFCSFASKYTTGPVTAPGVLGDHPAAAIVKGCSVGLTMRALAFPRVHELSIVQPSRWAFTAPYLANMSRVHSFAFLSCGEPVSRAPMLSERYSRLAAASLCSRISLRICASAAANGLFSSSGGFAKPRTATKTKTTPHTSTLNRRKLIRLPQPYLDLVADSTTRPQAPAVSTGFLDAQQPLTRFAPAFAACPDSADAARAGTSGRNSCCGRQQSHAGTPSRSGSSVFLRVHTPDGAADILPAGPRRQENRKSRTRAPKSPSAKRPAGLCAALLPVSC